MKQTAGTSLFLCIHAARETAIICTAETPFEGVCILLFGLAWLELLFRLLQ
jgi:hypothetical protein